MVIKSHIYIYNGTISNTILMRRDRIEGMIWNPSAAISSQCPLTEKGRGGCGILDPPAET